MSMTAYLLTYPVLLQWRERRPGSDTSKGVPAVQNTATSFFTVSETEQMQPVNEIKSEVN